MRDILEVVCELKWALPFLGRRRVGEEVQLRRRIGSAVHCLLWCYWWSSKLLSGCFALDVAGGRQTRASSDCQLHSEIKQNQSQYWSSSSQVCISGNRNRMPHIWNIYIQLHFSCIKQTKEHLQAFYTIRDNMTRLWTGHSSELKWKENGAYIVAIVVCNDPLSLSNTCFLLITFTHKSMLPHFLEAVYCVLYMYVPEHGFMKLDYGIIDI